MTKTKTITLTAGFRRNEDSVNDPLGYRVERVTDSLDYTPGDIITKREAETLCASREWKVTLGKAVG